MDCPICGSLMVEIFRALVLGKYEAPYDYCGTCNFIRVRDPFWLEEAYSRPIAATDTGLVARNLSVARKLVPLLTFLLRDRGSGRYLDYAGGYGLLTRLMRDKGFDFYWYDKYCPNIFAEGFEYHIKGGSCRAVTIIEAIEHAVAPVDFVSDALKTAQSDTVIFTTELFSGDPPSLESWWYYGPETGQHISLFSPDSLDALAHRLGLLLSGANGLYLMSPRRYNKRLFRFLTGRFSGLFRGRAAGLP